MLEKLAQTENIEKNQHCNMQRTDTSLPGNVSITRMPRILLPPTTNGEFAPPLLRSHFPTVLAR